MKKNLSRRDFLRTSLLAGTGLAITGVVGCAPATSAVQPTSAPAGSEKTFLNYWTGWSGFEFDSLQKLVDKFNTDHPNNFVNMTTVFGQYDKVLTAIAGGNPPDCVSAVWLNQLVSMGARGGLMPLTDLANKDGIDGKDYYPNVWDAWHYNGQLWGLAVTVNANVHAYRRDIFKEVGLDPANPPKTTADVDAATLKLEIIKDGNIERLGFVPGGLFEWAYVYGGSWYDDANKKVTADNPKNIAAMEWIASYHKRIGHDKIAAFQTGYGDFMSAQNPFFVGKEVIYSAGEWFISFINKYAPGLDFAYMTHPTPEGGNPGTTTFGGSVFTIPKGAKRPDASWEFMKWLSQPENMGQFAFEIHNIPPKPAVANEDRFIGDPNFKFCVDVYTGKNVFGPPKMPVMDQYATAITNAENDVVLGNKDAATALKEVTDNIQKELDKVKM